LDLTPDASAQSRKADVLALPKTADSKGSAGGKFSHDLEAVYGVAQARLVLPQGVIVVIRV
jgi:hypothetical protein